MDNGAAGQDLPAPDDVDDLSQARKGAMMKRQRGFSNLLIYGILAVVALGLLYGLYHAVDAAGYARAKAEWDEANRQEAVKEAERKAGEAKILAEEKEKRVSAETRAGAAELSWKEATDAARKTNRVLAGGGCPPIRKPSTGVAIPGETPVGPVAAADVEDSLGLRFTWEFVSLFDSIWTGDKGEPVFGTPQGVLTRAGQSDSSALSPYGPQEVIEANGKNAVWCSAVKRKYNSLLATIQRLEQDWDRAMAAAP